MIKSGSGVFGSVLTDYMPTTKDVKKAGGLNFEYCSSGSENGVLESACPDGYVMCGLRVENKGCVSWGNQNNNTTFVPICCRPGKN